MKLVTAKEMRALEQRADASGNTFAIMMERAGRAVTDTLTARLVAQGPRQNRVLVLVGPGNNGGDGLVCARNLFDMGAPVSLYVWRRGRKDSDEHLNSCIQRNIPVVLAENDAGFVALKDLLAHNDILVDALLGTGVSKPIEGTLKDLLAVVKAALNQTPETGLEPLVPFLSRRGHPLRVVAVDLPSGLNPDTGALDPATVTADLTVTFAFPKVGQLTPPGALAVGELVVADIGIPADWASDVAMEVMTAKDVAARLPTRSRESNKGTFGKAMICAGSANYIGAAYLAGSAATHAGAGLVTLALARTIHPIIAAASHETTYVLLPDEDGALAPDAVEPLWNALADYDALLIGPGFGRKAQTIDFVRQVLGIQPVKRIEGIAHSGEEFRLAQLVIDADALYALSQSPGWWDHLAAHGNSAILTPHPGEMARLCGLKISEVEADRIGVAKKFAALWHQVIVLKGAYTVVAEPNGRATLIPFATPALATAGTGDVLAGTITALLAQRLEPFDAAAVGAYLHGLAGKIAEEEIGDAGVVAGDLLPRLPVAIRRVREASEI